MPPRHDNHLAHRSFTVLASTSSTNIVYTTFTFFITMTVASTFLTFTFHYDFLVVLETFLAFPLRFLLGSSRRFFLTGGYCFATFGSRDLGALGLLKHLGFAFAFFSITAFTNTFAFFVL